MAELTVGSDQHIGCIGRTGSGKTFLMESLLEPQPNVLVVDDKQRVKFPGYSLTTSMSAALLEPKTIFRPKKRLPDEFWEDVMQTLHERGGGVCYIDELAVQTNPNFMATGLKDILRLGRELGVGLWWSAQSATEIYNTAIRQSSLMFCFQNIGASDRDKLIATTGDMGEVTKKLKLWEFLVFEAEGEPYDPAAIPAYKLVPNA